MGNHRICNGEYKCELSGANRRLVPDHIDRRVESGYSSATLHCSNFCVSFFLILNIYLHIICIALMHMSKNGSP